MKLRIMVLMLACLLVFSGCNVIHSDSTTTLDQISVVEPTETEPSVPDTYKDFSDDEPYRITFKPNDSGEGCVAVIDYNPYYEGRFILKIPNTDTKDVPVTRVETNATASIPHYVLETDFLEFLKMVEEHYGLTYEEAKKAKDESGHPLQYEAYELCRFMSNFVYRDIDGLSDNLKQELIENFPITATGVGVYCLDSTITVEGLAGMYSAISNMQSDFQDSWSYEKLWRMDLFCQEKYVEDYRLSEFLSSYSGLGQGVTDIEWPSEIQEIGDIVFLGCDSLTKVTVPGTISHVGMEIENDDVGNDEYNESTGSEGFLMFSSCENLTEIKFSEGIKEIGKVIYDCPNLKSVILPASLEKIDFIMKLYDNYDWGDFPEVYYRGTMEQWKCLFNIGTDGKIQYGMYAYITIHCADGDIFSVYENQEEESTEEPTEEPTKETTDPETEPETDPVAPSYSEGLKYISNGDGTCYVAGIGHCTDYDIFVGLTSPIGDRVIGVQDYAFQGCDIATITIPEGITSIGVKAFEGCKSLSVVNLPSSLTSIGGGAFYLCTNLKKITIPEGVTAINEFVFGSCRNLTSIVIPDGVTEIKSEAFEYCTNLMFVTIPDSVTRIGNSAFKKCESLISIQYSGTMRQWDAIEIEYWNDELLNARLHCADDGCEPDNPEVSEGLKFSPNGDGTCYVSGLGSCTDTDVVIPAVSPSGDSVTSIGVDAFWYCESLTDISYEGTMD